MNHILSLLSFASLIVFSPQDPQYVVTRGTATVRVPVDFMKISIGVRTSEATLKEANEKNKDMVLGIFGVLKNLAISDSDFVTTQSETQLTYSRQNERRLDVHYEAILTLRRPSQYDSLLAALASLGDVIVRIQSFGSNNTSKYAAEAYKKAISSARQQAELLVAGSNQRVGKILKLLQDGRDPFTQYDDIDQLAQRITQARPIDSERPPDFATMLASTIRRPYFDQTANVTVIFEIK